MPTLMNLMSNEFMQNITDTFKESFSCTDQPTIQLQKKKKRWGGFNILTSPKKLHAFVTEETK